MKQNWAAHELQEKWTLLPHEMKMVRTKSARWGLGFALQWKFFELEHRFVEETAEVPEVVVSHVAAQLGANLKHFSQYDLGSRTAKEHRTEIRALCGGWRPATVEDGQALVQWLMADVLDKTAAPHVPEAALSWLKDHHIEAPTLAVWIACVAAHWRNSKISSSPGLPSASMCKRGR